MFGLFADDDDDNCGEDDNDDDDVGKMTRSLVI